MPTNSEIIEAGPVAVLEAVRDILTGASGRGRLANIGELNRVVDLACGAVANAECGAYDAPPPVGVTPPAIGEALRDGIDALAAWVEIADDEDKRDSDDEALAAMRNVLAVVTASPAAVPPMVALMAEALAYEAHAFDNDECMDLADLCTWFGQWRTRVKAAL